MVDNILEVRGLKKHFPIMSGVVLKRQVGTVKAVDGVDLELRRGETLGLVGESGCGKSTVARTLMRLLEPTAGEAIFDGQDLFKLDKRDMRRARREIQMIFQDPYASLNPRRTVGDIVGEAYAIHGTVPKDKRYHAVGELLERVGLNPDHVNRYPHQFSGGQRQRVGIARALALKPKVIVCDEPVSALDVSVQAQVMNLLEDLQDDFGLSYIFIAHDLSIVRHISDRVAVMYLGRIVEVGTDADIYDAPTHPYTQALLSAVPIPDPSVKRSKDRILLEGDLPSPANPPVGCNFSTRCFKVKERCHTDDPTLDDGSSAGDHPSACFYAEKRSLI
ncbi:MAG: oligopeptide transport system ATP-binding protein [Glaciecola sp.]|jgi:oligopeptide transport system ATP-binding protein